MCSVFFVLFALPLSAQHLSVPCDASRKTLLLLEGVPPLRDVSIPFERRTGALRTLAERNPEDFFIQRAYQDSFRHTYHLADEFDRALAMYRKRASDPLSRYYEARLLMYAQPEASRATLEEYRSTQKTPFHGVRRELQCSQSPAPTTKPPKFSRIAAPTWPWLKPLPALS